MIHFLDASALVKRYVNEPGTQVIRSLIRSRRELAASRISLVEVQAALARRSREGDLAADAAHAYGKRVPKDLAAMRVVEPRSRVLELAASLGWEHPLRAYDAIQLASALHLARSTGLAMTFACSDARLCSVAKAVGLRMLLVTGTN